ADGHFVHDVEASGQRRRRGPARPLHPAREVEQPASMAHLKALDDGRSPLYHLFTAAVRALAEVAEVDDVRRAHAAGRLLEDDTVACAGRAEAEPVGAVEPRAALDRPAAA